MVDIHDACGLARKRMKRIKPEGFPPDLRESFHILYLL